MVNQPVIAGEAGAEAIIPLEHGSVPVRMEGGGPQVEVNVINQTSKEVDAEQQQPYFDGSTWVTNIILSDIRTNGNIRQAIQTVR